MDTNPNKFNGCKTMMDRGEHGLLFSLLCFLFLASSDVESVDLEQLMEADKYAGEKWSLYLRECHPNLFLPFNSSGMITEEDMKAYLDEQNRIGDVDGLKKRKIREYRREYFASRREPYDQTISQAIECDI